MNRLGFSRRIAFCFLIAFAQCYSSPGIAGRVVLSLPISTPIQRYNFQVGGSGEPLPNGPNKTRYGDPQRVGGSVIFEVKLVNLSNVKQSGSVELVRKSVYARTVCGDSGAILAFKGLLYLCGPLGSIVGSEFGGNLPFNYNTSVPSKVDFTVLPDDDVVVSLRYLFNTVFGDAPAGCKTGWSSLSSSFKVTINEDRGAVIGSVTPRFGSHSPSLTNGSTFQICAIPPNHELTFSGDFPDSGTGQVPLNGGRPF